MIYKYLGSIIVVDTTVVGRPRSSTGLFYCWRGRVWHGISEIMAGMHWATILYTGAWLWGSGHNILYGQAQTRRTRRQDRRNGVRDSQQTPFDSRPSAKDCVLDDAYSHGQLCLPVKASH